jgi:UDP-glucose 4-epimerase
MKLVVLGATGNVGTALLRQLAEAKPDAGEEIEVVGVARRIPPQDPPYDRASWESMDVADPGAAQGLARVFHGADAVINLVWSFQPARNVERLEAVGVGGLKAVLAAAKTAALPHLVHMSSVGAYSGGSYGRPVSESYPTDGIPTSPYSRHKAVAERLLDEFRKDSPTTIVTAVRPGLVMQREAASSLLRYALPALLPARAVGWLPVLPLDRRFLVPVIAADDVAAALEKIVRQRAGGAFNLAADEPLDRALLAAALHAWPFSVPAKVLRGLLTVTWRLHLQRLDPSWLDLAFSVPLLSTDRAKQELGWKPEIRTADAIRDVIAGARSAAATSSPVLRKRSVLGEIRDLRRGKATTRDLT